MCRSSRDSAGEESDEEWVEEQIEREESTESLEELGLPPSSIASFSQTHPRLSSSHSHLNPADLIVLDFGPSLKGKASAANVYRDSLLIFWMSLNCPEWLWLRLRPPYLLDQH